MIHYLMTRILVAIIIFQQQVIIDLEKVKVQHVDHMLVQQQLIHLLIPLDQHMSFVLMRMILNYEEQIR